MPVSKKPPGKASPDASQKAVAGWNLPDRVAMKSFLSTTTARRRREAIEKAQDLVYDAWERATARSRIALARKALGITPLRADAYSILAEEARSVEEARDLYARGVEAGELALGRKGFQEYAGHFWGFLETRPYMRARAGLAGALLKLGDARLPSATIARCSSLIPATIKGSAMSSPPASSAAAMTQS
jgi:hypothetical protein